jgi:DNA gyrase subunit B
MTTSTSYGAEQIVELDFLEAVRQRPGMYIGNNNLHGLHHLLLEVVDNSVDECMAGFANTISIDIEKDGTVTVSDNGRGIPVDYKEDSEMSALTQVMVRPHAGGKFNHSAYSASGGLHGIGLKATNAFSSFLEITVKRHGLTFFQRFENGGIPVTGVQIFDADQALVGEINAETQLDLGKKDLAKALVVNKKKNPVKADPDAKSGTRLRFRPNRAWFSREMEWAKPDKFVPWDSSRLDARFRQIAHLYPGVRIEYTDKQGAKPQKEVYFSKNGLLDYIEYLNEDSKPIHKPILFKSLDEIQGESGKETVETEIVMQYAGEETQIYSFVNAIPTPLGGTHVTAFKAGLVKAIKQFAADKKLLKASDDIRGDDVLLGLTAVVKVTTTSTPQFLSQTKESLTSPEVHGPVFSTIYGKLSDYLSKPANIGTGKLIVNQATAAARGRDAAAQARKLVIRKSALEAGEFVLGKLADLQRRGGSPTVPVQHTGLFLVEGDSAGGSCKQGRDSRYHAILPLRGKILNVGKVVKLSEVLKHQEIASIVAAIGAGVGTDFDVDAMRYGRVVITTDADVDGAHIATLLVTLFWRIMRPMIEAGKLYIAVPPLYLVKSKDQAFYAYNEQQRQEAEEALKGSYTIQRYKGLGEMNADQLRETLFAVPGSEERTTGRGRKAKAAAPGAEVPVTLADFTRHEILVEVDDVHRTNNIIDKLMGSAVGPRKEWLLNISWDEIED